jgi:hypothetical protein
MLNRYQFIRSHCCNKRANPSPTIFDPSDVHKQKVQYICCLFIIVCYMYLYLHVLFRQMMVWLSDIYGLCTGPVDDLATRFCGVRKLV